MNQASVLPECGPKIQCGDYEMTREMSQRSAQEQVQDDVGEVCEDSKAGYAMIREESLSHLSLREHACEAPEFQQMYHLEDRVPLAEGSFGLVWVCSERQSPEKVVRAVKIVQKSRLRPREFQLLLGEGGEIQTHLRLKHEHIVALYEAFDDLRTVSLVMEYCRGGDLFDAVTANWRAKGLGLPEHDASVALRHILLALAYLDSQHVVHRDIKCENVLLLHANVPIQSNVLKLCDFGFATYDDGNGLTDRLGSPDTVAPEVIIGRRYGTKADVWSAGVMLFMMLSARSPFWAPTDDLVLKRVRAAEWSMTGHPWNTVSEAAKACVRAMMTAEPSQRPTAMDMLGKHVWLSSDCVAAG
jgi:serine/threonine protein kinase